MCTTRYVRFYLPVLSIMQLEITTSILPLTGSATVRDAGEV